MSRREFTPEEDEIITRDYPDKLTSEIADKLNRTVRSVYGRAHNLGIKKSEQFFESDNSGRLNGKQGLSHRFIKGNKPWNTDMKGLQIGGKETQFKKGHVPPNYLPVGTINCDGEGYLKKKIADPNKWRYLHKLNWEQVNGKVPKGYVLTFLDGNKNNCELSNLKMISCKENMQRNTIAQYPEEIQSVMRIRRKLTNKLKEYGTSQVQ